MSNFSFKQLYEQAKKAKTPAQDYISRVAKATCREEATVRQWLCGTQNPTKQCKLAIAKEFDLPVEQLFPDSE